jgi:SpoU rRNA methylase family enzyme
VVVVGTVDVVVVGTEVVVVEEVVEVVEVLAGSATVVDEDEVSRLVPPVPESEHPVAIASVKTIKIARFTSPPEIGHRNLGTICPVSRSLGEVKEIEHCSDELTGDRRDHLVGIASKPQ